MIRYCKEFTCSYSKAGITICPFLMTQCTSAIYSPSDPTYSVCSPGLDFGYARAPTPDQGIKRCTFRYFREIELRMETSGYRSDWPQASLCSQSSLHRCRHASLREAWLHECKRLFSQVESEFQLEAICVGQHGMV